MSKSLSFYNLTGGLNTVQDLATINSTPNRTESPDMMNIEYYKLGGIQTMKGNKLFGQSFEEDTDDNMQDILCGIEYNIGNDSYLLIATREGKVYKYNKVTEEFEEISVGFTQKTIEGVIDIDFYKNERIYAVTYNNGIVFVNGNEALYYNEIKPELNKVWTPSLTITDEGTELTTIFHPTCIASYRGRLFMGANETEQSGETYKDIGMLFYSGVGLGIPKEDPDNPGEYLPWKESPNLGEDAGAFKEFFEDSSNFTGLGTWAEYLVVHKEQNTYILDGTNDLASEWELKPYSEYTVPSQQSYVICNNSYYAYVPEAGGIHPLLNRSIYNNTFQGGDISFKIKDSFDFLDTLNYDKIYAVYHPRKKYVMFYMPTLNGNGSNYCYIYDIQTKTWLFRRVPQYVTCAFKFDNEVYIGVRETDNEGNITTKVVKEFSGKTFNGIPIDFYYLTPPFIWGGGTNKTTTKEFRVKLVNSSANHFYIESFKDGATDTKEQRLTKNINDNLSGLLWDIGLSKEDKLYDHAYRDATFYRFIGADGNNYYTKQYPLTANTMIYSQLTTIPDLEPPNETLDESNRINETLDESNRINYYQYFQKDNRVATTSSDPDAIEEITQLPSYAWNLQTVADWCYKNGNYYAWVNQDTGLCTTNLVIQTKSVQSKVAFQMVNYSLANSGIVAVKKSDYDNNWNTPNLSLYAWTYNNGTWTHTAQGGSVYINTSSQPNGTAWKDNRGRGVYIITSGISALIGGVTNRTSQYDEYTQTTMEAPSGTEPGSITKGTKTPGASSITINVLGVGNITLSRYSAGDRNQKDSDTNYYTDSATPSVGDKAYLSTELTGTNYNITGVTNTTITTSTGTLTRYPQGDSTHDVSEYYKLMTLTYDGVIKGVDEIYKYPDDDDPIWEQTLTDTTWDFSATDEPYIIDRPVGANIHQLIRTTGNSYEDISSSSGVPGDAWLQPGYQTKRMLLPNQYFETVQFKFSGGGYDKEGNARYSDNICISGFEVDGIQLAETPWA